MMDFFHVYKPNAWLLIICSFILMATIGALATWIEHRVAVRQEFKLKEMGFGWFIFL